MAIQVVLGMEERLGLAGLAATIEAVEDLEVPAVATSHPTVEQLAIQHRPQVIVVDTKLVTELPQNTWLPATPRALVLLNSGKQFVYRRHRLQERFAGLILVDEAYDLIAEAVRVAAEGHVFLSRGAYRLMLPQMSAVPEKSKTHKFLSNDEQQLLGLVAQGLSDIMVAEEAGISRRTVQNRLRRIYNKLGVGSRVEAVVVALKMGMLDI